ncbi:DUF2793 domain-containing protein [Chelativorans sp. AA-79]|uniref:DUF2793 domain-containing protein n=1 Tax=Chelativorans sp. AA-79 TaxID=3028735 RepID=UPI0023F64333|nr:DUF2793 domain-containing protein [Chelativorans sp. AA-79]WEX10236.1 DUF2793 domain-containing protein [Chelativorans sp. AA-79]
MSEETPNLNLPYIMPSQAQKHVTHNEAIRALDALVQIGVLGRGVQSPPDAPAEGARYIVGDAPAEGWEGQAGRIAAFQDGAWAFYAPRAGWLAYVASESLLVVHDGAEWQAVRSGLSTEDLRNLEGVGVNAAPDAVNRLAVSAPATLFSHEGAGHQVKVNKNAAADTASLLFQTGWSGRAEMGLAGNDDFSVKVSADGAAWFTGLTVRGADGAVDAPAGLSAGGNAVWHAGNFAPGAKQDALDGVRAVEMFQAKANGTLPTYIDLHTEAGTDYETRIVRWNNSNATKPGWFEIANSGSGTLSLTPSGPVWNTYAIARDGSSPQFGNQVRLSGEAPTLQLTETDTNISYRLIGDVGALYIQAAAPSGNAGMIRFSGWASTDIGALQVRYDGTFRNIHHSGAPINLRGYTVAELPNAASVGAGAMVFVSDDAGSAAPAFSDGVGWRRMADNTLISPT